MNIKKCNIAVVTCNAHAHDKVFLFTRQDAWQVACQYSKALKRQTRACNVLNTIRVGK